MNTAIERLRSSLATLAAASAAGAAACCEYMSAAPITCEVSWIAVPRKMPACTGEAAKKWPATQG